jgi:hypothetical protein
MRAREFLILTEQLEQLDEIVMSQSNLSKEVARIPAQVGIEFEMIVPVSDFKGSSENEDEFDFSTDSRIRSMRQIMDFFSSGYYSLTSRELQNLSDGISEEFYESDFYQEATEKSWQEWLDSEGLDWIVKKYNIEDANKAEKKLKKLLNNQDDDAFQEMYDAWREEAEIHIHESDYLLPFLRSMGIEYLSDLANHYDITWPYITDPYESNLEDSIKNISDSFKKAVGKPINWATSYHQAERSSNAYSLEPDGSIDTDKGELGLEFISPPQSIDESFNDLKKVRSWAKSVGASTNESTGLHINVSISNKDFNNLDYVKLVLLLGDKYVLDQFGRSSNTYAKSSLDAVAANVSTDMESVQKVLAMLRGRLNSIASKLIHSGETSKYTSINVKDGYVEFRSPGGDWLGKNYDKIENTLLRFVVALDAALDPTKYQEEYYKKLYKMLTAINNNNETNTIQLFSQYSAGKLTKQELKSILYQSQLKRKGSKDQKPTKEPGGSKSYEIFKLNTREITHKFNANSDEEALLYFDRYIPAENRRYYDVRHSLPQPSGFTGQWMILDPDGQEIHRFGGIGDAQSDANRVAMNWLRQNPEHIRQGVEVVPVTR